MPVTKLAKERAKVKMGAERTTGSSPEKMNLSHLHKTIMYEVAGAPAHRSLGLWASAVNQHAIVRHSEVHGAARRAATRNLAPEFWCTGRHGDAECAYQRHASLCPTLVLRVSFRCESPHVSPTLDPRPYHSRKSLVDRAVLALGEVFIGIGVVFGTWGQANENSEHVHDPDANPSGQTQAEDHDEKENLQAVTQMWVSAMGMKGNGEKGYRERKMIYM
jgi:hypothetical protein